MFFILKPGLQIHVLRSEIIRIKFTITRNILSRPGFQPSINQVFDFISAIRDGKKVKPDFMDGYICQKVLDSGQRSTEEKEWIKIE